MEHVIRLLKDALTEEELRILPRGFNRIGHVIILSLPNRLIPKSMEIAGALLQIGGVRTVMLNERGITGRFREPGLRFLAGEPNTETVHRENGCLFKLDVAKVMFSPGNMHELSLIHI